MDTPMIPDTLLDTILADARTKSVILQHVFRRPVFRRPPPPPPWYRRLWQRIDRYVPRVRVSIGPRDRSRSCEDWW